MAGTVMQVIPKRTLDFISVLSGIPQAQEIVLVQGIDISAWCEVFLMVRVHSNSIPGAIGTIQVYGYLEGRTSEDPGLLFTTAAPLGAVTIDNTTVAPSYAVNTIPSNAGAMMKVACRGTRTGSTGTNLIKADVSIDLSLKSA